MTFKLRERVVGMSEDGVKVKRVVCVDAYDRVAERRVTRSAIREAQQEDVAVASDADDRAPEVRRMYHLGVDRDSLIETFGKKVYHSVFAELDANERLRVMLSMLDE